MFCFAGTGKKKKKVEKKYDMVTNKCVVDCAMTFIHGKIFHLLNREHIKLLFKTPFLHFFVMPKKMQVSNAVLHSILVRYDNENGYFNILGKKLHFSCASVGHFLCLPAEGQVVDLSQVRVSTSPLRLKYFPGHISQLRRYDLEDVIEDLVKKQSSDPQDARDVVSLLVLYLFTAILFPNTAGSVPLQFFRYAKYLCNYYM